MLSKSLIQQIKCRWIEFKREPSAFFWVVFMPIMWMVILGFAFSNPQPERYGVGVVESQSFPQQYKEALANSSQLNLRVNAEKNLNILVGRGEISLIVNWVEGKPVYTLDKANPEAVRARNFVNDLIQIAAGRADPLAVKDETLDTIGGRYVDFLVPGLLGLSIMTSSLFGVGMTIVANRRENLLKRYLATPMRPYEYLVSHVFGRMIVLVTEFIAVVVSSYLIFGFKIHGSFLSYAVFCILGAACFTAIALLCASRTKSIPMVSGITNLICLPMMMLSGVFFSKNNFPDWLRSIVDFLPLTALNDGLRKIALEDQAFANLGQETMVLGMYFIVASLLCVKAFKWY